MKSEKGFTLVEMAMVIVILSLILGTVIVPLSATKQMEMQNQAKEDMAVINKALLAYVFRNLVLPPASPTTNGIAAPPSAPCSEGSTTAPCRGFLPFATLGTPSVDPWGKYYMYSVCPSYTNPAISASTPSTISTLLANASSAANRVVSNDPNGNPGNNEAVVGSVAAVIFSYGARNWGVTVNGTVPDLSGTNISEDFNNSSLTSPAPSGGYTPAAPNVFIKRDITQDTNITGGEFDDLVAWVRVGDFDSLIRKIVFME